MATAPMLGIDHDRQLVDHALLELAKPAGVGKPNIEFRPDHTGDDSIYLVFPNSKKIPLTQERLKALSTFSIGLQFTLFDAGVRRIPYVRFVDAR